MSLIIYVHRRAAGGGCRRRPAGGLLLLHEGQQVPVRRSRPPRNTAGLLEVHGEGQARAQQVRPPRRRDEEDARVLPRQGPERGEDRLGDARVRHGRAEEQRPPQRSTGTHVYTCKHAACYCHTYFCDVWLLMSYDRCAPFWPRTYICAE